MSRDIPNINVKYFGEIGSYDGDFSTLFILFLPQVKLMKPIALSKRYQFDLIDEIRDIDFLRRAVNAYYANGGDRLYLLFYQIDESFNILKFDNFLSKSCDRLNDIETISAINLYDDTIYKKLISIRDILEIQRVINDYCERSHRVSISDVDSDFKKEYLNIIGRTNIYYPWIADSKDSRLPPSIYVAALFSKIAKVDRYFESIANRPLFNCRDVDLRLDDRELMELTKEGINPLIFMPHRGIMIWGVKCFNESFDSVNELRVMKYIKRRVIKSSRVYIFEVNNPFLEAQIILMLKVFLDHLEKIGALESYNIGRDDSSMQRDNEIVINIEIALSSPIEFINIRYYKSDKDGVVSIV